MLLALLFLAASTVTTADAMRSVCRKDPIVWFTDGTRLQMTAAVETAPENIQMVVYTVHLPSAKEVARVVHTARGLGLNEQVEFVVDSAPGTYAVETVVYLHSGEAAVTAYSSYNGSQRGTATGSSGESLLVSFEAE